MGVILIALRLALTIPCFSPPALAQDQGPGVTKPAKKKADPRSPGPAQPAAKKPRCAPSPERACYQERAAAKPEKD
ncbi:hypothetical protein [Bradyrhizobium sp. CCBAU 51753]|uniref:hypothetical protein n=1 Tax=Bradyrhizobium sp. CCBAU 51753 TaxID=1325100 RepID=UPI001889F8DD|nr:hypothetical protein [Bradyrhizobium sp. CCBAU 51753]QOZ26285.1 hypothetical protein XH93_23800 [Bradyrhizobium sp. CCBAU 51753]